MATWCDYCGKNYISLGQVVKHQEKMFQNMTHARSEATSPQEHHSSTWVEVNKAMLA